MEILSVSHSNTLARDIADKTRLLMSTPFYRECFPATEIRDDRGAVMDFATTAGGSRLSGSFDTSLTGRGADLTIVDDPLSAQDAGSEKERENLINSFEQMVATRLNDPRTGRILIVGQRVHENV
ncbi:hypothetical protein [Mesorhizobium escarrei]|nr:hypothetical protein [Mesorhizobium escarrei]